MDGEFKKNVNEKEQRRMAGRSRKKTGTLAWIGMLGIIGWSITLPLLIGIALGRWLETVFPGKYSFTLMFMFAGLAIGCVAAWKWVKKSITNHKSQIPKEDGGEKRGPNDAQGK